MFEWDKGNIEHIIEHSITPEEVEQAYFNEPLIVDEQNRAGETRFLCLGETDRGRLLSFVFTERGENVRIVTAYPMHKKQRAFYLAQEE